MEHIEIGATIGGGAHAYPHTSTRKARAGRKRHRPARARYADAGRSAREAITRLREAEQQAREEGRRVPASCSRVLLEIVGEVSTYSRRNDVLSVARLVTLTGLSRNTVRAALERLEAYGCISRVTPENVPGKATGDTIIALPIVEPGVMDEADEDADEDDQHHDAAPPSPAARLTRPRSVWVDRTPGQSGLTPSEKYPREKYEGEAKRSGKRREEWAPDGRSKDRPPPTLEGGNPNPDHEPDADEYADALARMRDGHDCGSGIDPRDVRIVERWERYQRDKAQREAQARRAKHDHAEALTGEGMMF